MNEIQNLRTEPLCIVTYRSGWRVSMQPGIPRVVIMGFSLPGCIVIDRRVMVFVRVFEFRNKSISILILILILNSCLVPQWIRFPDDGASAMTAPRWFPSVILSEYPSPPAPRLLSIPVCLMNRPSFPSFSFGFRSLASFARNGTFPSGHGFPVSSPVSF